MVENRRKLFPWMLIGGNVLLVLAVLAWVKLNQPVTPVKTPTPATVSQVQRVPLVDAKTAFDSGSAVFLDVRDSDSYAAAHIPGAFSIPISDLLTRMGELNQRTWLIPY